MLRVAGEVLKLSSWLERRSVYHVIIDGYDLHRYIVIFHENLCGSG